MATLREVTVPDIGDFADVPVVEILVGPGDTVAAEDPLVTLESDKASLDVPAPFAGIVGELRVALGDRVSEGAALLSMTVEHDAGASAEAASPGAVKTAIAAEAAAAPDPPGPPPPAPPERSLPGGPAVYASPSVRRSARERGVDLTGLVGSGRKGRILPEDVEDAPGREGYAAGVAEHEGGSPADAPGREGSAGGAPDAVGAGLGLAPWPQVDFARYGPIESIALSRIKRLSGPNLARNWVRIPHVTHHDDADITELEAFRLETNRRLGEQGVKLTMLALLLKACVATLVRFPEFNASLDATGENLIVKRYYHLGFAADTPQGLMVPVIRDVDAKGLIEIAAELRERSERARNGRLGPSEMAGGTFTISSLGGIGGTGFTPIINAPEVAILGVTRSRLAPVWDGSQFLPRLLLGLSLSYDHRVIDGAAAARFTAYLAEVLNDLRRVLL